jgi:hypothetical protein
MHTTCYLRRVDVDAGADQHPSMVGVAYVRNPIRSRYRHVFCWATVDAKPRVFLIGGIGGHCNFLFARSIMHQYQVIVETNGHRLFATNWVTGRDAIEPLALLLASLFPEPTYLVTIAHRVVDLTATAWGDFIVGHAV